MNDTGTEPIAVSAISSRRFSARTRTIIVLLLLFVGAQFALIVGHALFPPRMKVMAVFAGIAVVSCIPFVARRVDHLLNRLRRPSNKTRLRIAIAIAVLSPLLLYAEARNQQRTFMPKYQDEFSYLIQTRMIAHGRLWMQAHPCADFFDSFQFMAAPVYASIYFPGAAMLYAPGIWLGLPFWVMPLCASGIVLALVYWIIAELIDGAAGLLAAIMMMSLTTFRLISIMPLAQAPTMLFALAMIASWLRWRRDRRWKWALVIGLFAGWCAITRPVDALCVAIPIGIAMLIEVRAIPFRQAIACIIAGLLGTIPFLTIQLIFNVGVTGRLTQTPFDYFAALCYPQTQYGFHGFDPSIRPASPLPQKQRFYDEHTLPFLREHTPALKFVKWRDTWLPMTILNGSAHVLMLVLMPVGLLGLIDRRRWLVFAALPLFVLLYFPYVFFLTHYTLISAAAVVLLILLGAEVLINSWPKARANISVFLVCATAMLSISEMSYFNRSAWDEFFVAPELQQIDNALARLEHKPALVLFRFGSSSTAHIEPVYNISTLWPDDADVIRAHDLGIRNAEIFEYYARRQPHRAVYRYDREDGSVHYLGRVDELAGRL